MMNNIGLRLKEYRECSNITQSELARITGISQQNISRWEKGINIPNATDCIALANHFGITIDELLGREDYGTGRIVITGEQLSSFEKKLLGYLRKLPMDDQYQVLGFIQALAL